MEEIQTNLGSVTIICELGTCSGHTVPLGLMTYLCACISENFSLYITVAKSAQKYCEVLVVTLNGCCIARVRMFW